jgi:hypothetical protein
MQGRKQPQLLLPQRLLRQALFHLLLQSRPPLLPCIRLRRRSRRSCQGHESRRPPRRLQRSRLQLLPLSLPCHRSPPLLPSQQLLLPPPFTHRTRHCQHRSLPSHPTRLPSSQLQPLVAVICEVECQGAAGSSCCCMITCVHLLINHTVLAYIRLQAAVCCCCNFEVRWQALTARWCLTHRSSGSGSTAASVVLQPLTPLLSFAGDAMRTGRQPEQLHWNEQPSTAHHNLWSARLDCCCAGVVGIQSHQLRLRCNSVRRDGG